MPLTSFFKRRLPDKPSTLPSREDFPPGTTFVIKEFDVPLARVPDQGWFNWFTGTPRPYDPSSLTVSNNWPARDFEEWARLIQITGDIRRRVQS